MKNLSLSKNNFGDTGIAALLDCLFNIEELELADCKLSPETKAKIKERAREMSVTVRLAFMFESEEKTQGLNFFNFTDSSNAAVVTSLQESNFSSGISNTESHIELSLNSQTSLTSLPHLCMGSERVTSQPNAFAKKQN